MLGRSKGVNRVIQFRVKFTNLHRAPLVARMTSVCESGLSLMRGEAAADYWAALWTCACEDYMIDRPPA
jgi:hypothetical protein